MIDRNGKGSHIPVVIGVAVAADKARRFITEILDALAGTFAHTDWIIVAADGSDDIRVFENPAGWTLSVREHVNPRAGFPSEPDNTAARASATYLLRTCSLIFVATGHAAPCKDLKDALEQYQAMLPLETPSAGNRVSVFSLPEPAPQIEISAKVIPDLRRWSVAALAELKPQKFRMAARFVRREHEVEASSSKPEHSVDRAREVLSQWARVDEFNGDAAEWEFKQETTDTPADSPLARRCAALNEQSIDAGERGDLAMINRAFVAADRLSGRWQQSWHRLRLTDLKGLANFQFHDRAGWPRFFSLFMLTILAACFLALASEFAEESPFPSGWIPEAFERVPGSIFFLLYATMLAIGLWRLVVHRARRIESRHQDYRLLAEGLRVQFFWSATAPYGVSIDNAMHSYVADHIPLARRNAMFWVRGALHAVRFAASPQRTVGMATPVRAKAEWDAIAPCLLDDQLLYHKDNLVGRRQSALHRLNRWSRAWLVIFIVFFILLLARAVVQLLHPLHLPAFDDVGSFVGRFFESTTVAHCLVIAMVVSLVTCLSAREVAEGFGLEAEIRRGESTSAVLASAQHHWRETATTPANVESPILNHAIERREMLLFELGRVMIDDYAEWFNIHRERPAQPIHG